MNKAEEKRCLLQADEGAGPYEDSLAAGPPDCSPISDNYSDCLMHTDAADDAMYKIS